MISLEESMKAPGKVRLPTPGQGRSPLPDSVAEQLRATALAAGDRDGATHVPWPSGPRWRPPATAYGAQGCLASPRAALGLARLPRGRRLLPEAGQAHVGRGRRLRRRSGRTKVRAAFRGARPRRPQAETAAAPAAREGRALPAQRRRKRGGRASWARTGAALRRGTSTHRASVLNDDLLGQHDTAVRGPFLFLPLGHFTILDSRRCSSHSRGGRPQRRVRSRHYCRAEPLRAHAAILRARPASGGASHRAIG